MVRFKVCSIVKKFIHTFYFCVAVRQATRLTEIHGQTFE
jgi:hypothetical protein